MLLNKASRLGLLAFAFLLISCQAFSQAHPDSNIVRLDTMRKAGSDIVPASQYQASPDLKLTPLDTLKIINNKQLASQYNIILNTSYPNSFIVKDRRDTTRAMAKKVDQNKWVIYNLPVFEGFLRPNRIWIPESEPKLQGEFITYTVSASSNQSGIIYYRGDTFIIDVKRHAFLELTALSHYENYAQQLKYRKHETYDQHEKRQARVENPYTEVNTAIHLNGEYLTLKVLFERNGKKYYPPFRD